MKKYKRGDLVLYKNREGMGVPGRLDFAEIVKVTRTSYDTKPFDFKKSKSAKGWTLSLFEHDIICRVNKKNAAECHRTMNMTYAISDNIIASLNSGLKKTEEGFIKYLKSREKFLKRK